MKVAGNGQGKILTPEELKLLFTEGFVGSAIALCLASVYLLVVGFLKP